MISDTDDDSQEQDEREEDSGAEDSVPESSKPDAPDDASEDPGEQEPEELEPGRPPIEEEDRSERGAGRLQRLATGAISAVAEAGAATDPRGRGALAVLRRFIVPIGVLVFLAILFTLFHEILLPFIFALVIVYLMEPIVRRLGPPPQDPTGIPRWVAVILVYVVFFGILTTSTVLIVPQFVSEIVRLGETFPEEVQEFRSKTLPDINDKLQSTVRDYLPLLGQGGGPLANELGAEPTEAINEASAHVLSARREAGARAIAFSEASRIVGLASRANVEWSVVGEPGFETERVYRASYPPAVLKQLERPLAMPQGGYWTFVGVEEQPTFRMEPTKGGGFEFYLEDADVELEQVNERTWRVRKASTPRRMPRESRSNDEGEDRDEAGLASLLDLEEGLDDLVEEVVKSSNAQLTSLISFAQQLVVGIIQAFVALVLTLMVAAFITIDLPGVMSFFRNLIPSEHRDRYDELLSEFDRGLSGVVRGQLLICMVNGVLTYIGLVILDIKFSLLLAVVAGVLSLIPIFGTILSTIPIVMFAITDGLMTGVLALGWILGIHFLEANILNPKIIGTSAHIHPVIVIFALLAGESAFGLVGALLAVPTASILLTLFKFFLMRVESGQEALRELDTTTPH